VTKSTNNSSEAQDFPISCYVGIPAELAVKLEDRLHPLNAMFSIKVMNYELNNIIEPCLNHPKIDSQIKAKLGKKKIELEKQRKVRECAWM